MNLPFCFFGVSFDSSGPVFVDINIFPTLQVKVFVVDEISMCGSNKFAKMNYQVQSLQDGPAKKEFFGGKSLILLGDLKQLPPGTYMRLFIVKLRDAIPLSPKDGNLLNPKARLS